MRTIPPVAAACCLAVLAVAGCDHPFAPGLDGFLDEVERRKGTLVSADAWLTESEPGHRIHDFELLSSSGLRVRGRIRTHPEAGAEDQRAGVILLGGLNRGGDAVELLPTDQRPSAAAIWYPEDLDADDAADALRRVDELADLAWDIPASVLLLVDYMVTRPDIDPTRLAAVGASFGGFFVPIAAAADERIRNVALIYAGGDLAGLLAHHLSKELPPSAAVLGAEVASLRLQRIEPTRYMPAIAPRHVLIVNGLHDDLVTRRSAEALIAATRPPRDVVWLPTGHLDPDNEPLLRELVDTAFSRLPILDP